ncbi:hypothetical protein CERSUDRAFT_83908 [Gelatoporia subvermispora B]|uniref:Uncharacterized protein n=1 Tax=Ceriporiopsis subvermispora (strain B) TaxID=914234 RepID=M2RDI3_CERS8|nr:hypothetical protein CERSUDRAFT_83908 [Gelatoporia subvermispora B]
MLVAECTRRSLLAGSFSASLPLRRCMSTAAPALCLPAPDASPTFVDFNILDIFDAPCRLGESSRLLAMSAHAARARASRPVRSISTASLRKRPTVKPLPPPVTFDGPSRPRYIMSTHHNRRTPKGSVAFAVVPPPPLPEPQLFDGPSKLRPYAPRGFRTGSGVLSQPSLVSLILGLSGAAFVYGVNNKLEGSSSSLDHSLSPWNQSSDFPSLV